ncbi:helix-turn-helix transcriptional regulator [Microbacterium mangrovi]|uniref:helix-turn-helix transcriptional regulator n=1 Tax=Microbacterium mangrovi TaxID=1348253 RepID=UPI0018CEAFC9|nr:helix-turn-helix transcriptional regulator [Microbacterium mangrovi]
MTDPATPTPPYLEEDLATDDIGVADAILQRLYPVAHFRESRGPFRLEQTTRGAGGITFVRFKTESWIDNAVEFEQMVGFGFVLGGMYEARTGREQLDTTRPFLFRPGPASATSEQIDIMLVNIDLDVLTRSVLQRAGVDEGRLSLCSTAPVSEAMRRHWTRTVGYTWTSVLQEPEVFRNDLARSGALEAVLATATAAFPVEVLHAGRAHDAVAVSRAVRIAREYIEHHADAPLTVDLIARQAHVSVRALQNAFRRDLDTTPLAYLRRVRLTRARDELLDGGLGTVSVADVARQWGFTNLGRFAAEYAALFGEKPSRTLRS